MRISSQIASFRSPLIPDRQLTAVGFKIPALRVAYDDLPDDRTTLSYGVMKATRIRPETGLTRSPEAEPEPRRPSRARNGSPRGTGAAGTWLSGTYDAGAGPKPTNNQAALTLTTVLCPQLEKNGGRI